MARKSEVRTSGTVKVKCMVCKLVVDSKNALRHWQGTGHNLWELQRSKAEVKDGKAEV